MEVKTHSLQRSQPGDGNHKYIIAVYPLVLFNYYHSTRIIVWGATIKYFSISYLTAVKLSRNSILGNIFTLLIPPLIVYKQSPSYSLHRIDFVILGTTQKARPIILSKSSTWVSI